jgi:hypothetical protein
VSETSGGNGDEGKNLHLVKLMFYPPWFSFAPADLDLLRMRCVA